MEVIKVDNQKIEDISDYVSGVVHSFVDDFMFEGAYVSCKARNSELSDVVLHLVYIDYRFKGEHSKEDLEKVCRETGVHVSIMNDPYWMLGYNWDGTIKKPYGESLLNGHIIFDRNGNLGETQRLSRLNHLVSSMEDASIVSTEPPIQYKKTN